VNPRRKNSVLIPALIAAAMIGSYTLGRHHTEIGIAAAAERQPLYYQDPSGRPDYSPTPKKNTEGHDYVPVYDEPGAAPASTPAPPAPAAAAGGDRKILYYRNPMGLPDTSPVPKKDSMGMDYIPVYADKGSGAVPGTVTISPERIQMLGVRTEAASLRPMAHTVRAVGTVAADERRIGVVNPKFEGWIEQLHVSTTGQTVRRGEPLLEVYSPDLVLAQREYLVARSAATDMAHADAMARETISPERIQMLGVRTEAASLAPHAFAPAARPPERARKPSICFASATLSFWHTAARRVLGGSDRACRAVPTVSCSQASYFTGSPGYGYRPPSDEGRGIGTRRAAASGSKALAIPQNPPSRLCPRQPPTGRRSTVTGRPRFDRARMPKLSVESRNHQR
jgi:hypothetical protein